jgi:hypothetical protein
MKKSAYLITAIVPLAFAAAALAQEATPKPSPTPEATPEATPKSTPTPAPKEETKKPEATPRPTPASIPAPEGVKPSIPPDAADSDASLLPPPVDATGAGEEPPPPPPDDSLPADSSGGTEALNPDATLVPPDATGAPEDVPPPAPKIAENKFKEARDLQVRYQEVKLQALKDDAVRSLHEQADAAKTDEGKRQALREYYRLLFAKMVSIDKDLEKKCDEMQKAYLRRLGQYRVEPTIPLNPPPTPAPIEMAEASPTPKPKSRRGN